MCKACFRYYRNAARLTAYAAGVLVAMGVAAAARAEDKPVPSCFAYDKYKTRGSETPIPSNCDTLSPELGGLRSKLVENGFNFEGILANLLPTMSWVMIGARSFIPARSRASCMSECGSALMISDGSAYRKIPS